MANKFKVGDTVRIIESGWSTAPEDVGRKTTVLGVRGDGYIIYDARHLSIEGDEKRGHVNGFELAQPRGLEVGDKVLVINQGGDGITRHYLDIGSVATVIGRSFVKDNVTVKGYSKYHKNFDGTERQTVNVASVELIEDKPLDFSKPLETYEGTPVKLLATGGVDAKWPVLVLEGVATLPTKYDLNGKAKNGVARRFIRNVEAKPVVKAPKAPPAYYVNIYPGDVVGDGRFDSRKAADDAYNSLHAAMGPPFAATRIGVARIQRGFYAD